MKNVCPCKYCVAPKRHAGCHAKCQEYIDWNEVHQIRKASIREANKAEDDCLLRCFRNDTKRRKR